MRKRLRQAYQLLDRTRRQLVRLWDDYLLPLAPVPLLVVAVVVVGMWIAPDEVPADRCPQPLPATPPASVVPVPEPDSGDPAEGAALGVYTGGVLGTGGPW